MILYYFFLNPGFYYKRKLSLYYDDGDITRQEILKGTSLGHLATTNTKECPLFFIKP
jgi:hypothetical protein